MGLTLAEQLLLLIYRPDGTADGTGSKLDVQIKIEVALAGALLSELASAGYVEFAERRVRVATGDSEPSHPRLRSALTILAKKPRKPDKALQVLARQLRKSVRTDLVEAGIVNRRSRSWRLPRYELIEPGVRDELNGKLHAALFGGSPPDRDLCLLIPVLATARLSNRVLVGEDPDDVQRRLDRLTEAGWLVEGLKRAVIAARVQAGIGVVVEIVIPVVVAASK